MITSEEFNLAMQVIANYKLQVDRQLREVVYVNQKINIQGEIKAKSFRVLQKYYEKHYGIRLYWEDLTSMDRNLLETIDYEKLKFIKGYDGMSIYNFKKLMISHAIIDG